MSNDTIPPKDPDELDPAEKWLNEQMDLLFERARLSGMETQRQNHADLDERLEDLQHMLEQKTGEKS